MIKSMLAAVEGGAESLAGLRQAVSWAEQIGASLRVVSVLDERRFVTYPTYSDAEGMVPRPIPMEGEALRDAEATAAQEEAELRAAYEAAIKGHTVRSELRQLRGPVGEVLVRESRAADLVVMGRRGNADFADSVGATTEMLVQESLRPVVVVPPGAHIEGPILLAFDDSPGVQRAMVPGVALAAALQCSVTVLSLAKTRAEGEAIQAPLRDYLLAHEVEADFRVLEGRDTERSTAKLILGAASELGAGMVVMGAFSVGPIREFFVGSVTRGVLAHAQCPVLMMN